MVAKPVKPPILPAKAGTIVNHTISINQEKWIGRVVVEFSKLEAAMADLIWHFLDLPMEFGRIITTRLDASTMSQMLRSLNLITFQTPHREKLKDIIDRIDIIREDRNFIMHGTWGRSHPDGTPIALSLRPKGTPSTVVSETFPEYRMKQIHKEIIKLKEELVSQMDLAREAHHKEREQYPTN